MDITQIKNRLTCIAGDSDLKTIALELLAEVELLSASNPAVSRPMEPITKEWCMKMATLEPDDGDISAGVPNAKTGWKLVPMEPTDAMTYAGQKHRYNSVWSIGAIYREMLAASPAAPTAQAGGEAQEVPFVLTEDQIAKIAHYCETEAHASPGTNMWMCAHMAVEETLRTIAELDLHKWIAEVCEDADGLKHIEAVIEDLDDLPKGTRLYAAPQSSPPVAGSENLRKALERIVKLFSKGVDPRLDEALDYAFVALSDRSPSVVLDDERAAFEMRERARRGFGDDTLTPYPEVKGEYLLSLVQARWEGWQARVEYSKRGATGALRELVRLRDKRDAFHKGDQTWTQEDDDQAIAAFESARSVLARAASPQAMATQPAQTALTVWYGSMPESNGKTNWTAILHNGDMASGITLDRSEYPDRVRYEADRARWLIGELTEEPFILDYDADKHSGYVAPAQAQTERALTDDARDAARWQWARANLLSASIQSGPHKQNVTNVHPVGDANTATFWDALADVALTDAQPESDGGDHASN